MATATIDYQGQRQILEDEVQKAKADLEEMAGQREVCSLDTAIGQAAPGALEKLEKKMIQRTSDQDRAVSSLAELGRREAASIAATQAAERKRLEKELAKACDRTKDAGAKLVDAVDLVAAVLAEAEAADQAAGALASQLGMEAHGARSMRGSRTLLHLLLVGKLGQFGRIEVGLVGPRDADGYAEALASAAAYRVKRTTQSVAAHLRSE